MPFLGLKLIPASTKEIGRFYRVQLLHFCCSSVSVLVLLLRTHLVSFQCWILIYMFAVLMHWWVWRTSEPEQNLGRGLCTGKTGLSPPVIYYWPFQGGASVLVYFNSQCSSALCLSLTLCSFYLCGHLLGRGCPLGFPLVLFLSQLYVSLSR